MKKNRWLAAGLAPSLALSLMFLMGACSSTFDPTQTTVVFEYNTPQIDALAIEDTAAGSAVTVTLSVNLNTSQNSDFSGYWIFLSKPNQAVTAVNTTALGDFTNASQIPFYYGSTTKPSFSGNFVVPLNFTFSRGLARFETYQISAVAWGFNADYGKVYKNNGWLYSPAAAPASFHLRKQQTITLTNNSGFYLDLVSATLKVVATGPTPVSNSQAQLAFFQQLKDGELGSFFTTTVKGSRMISWGSSAAPLSQVLTFPQVDDSYLPPQQALPAVKGHVYLMKHADNTYSKFLVEEIKDINLSPETLVRQATLKSYFTTEPNQRNF